MKLYPFICKVFENNQWRVLGTVYAEDNHAAWVKAHELWKRVDSVYDLYSSD
jgi:hypothetical protein